MVQKWSSNNRSYSNFLTNHQILGICSRDSMITMSQQFIILIHSKHTITSQYLSNYPFIWTYNNSETASTVHILIWEIKWKLNSEYLELMKINCFNPIISKQFESIQIHFIHSLSSQTIFTPFILTQYLFINQVYSFSNHSVNYHPSSLHSTILTNHSHWENEVKSHLTSYLIHFKFILPIFKILEISTSYWWNEFTQF